MTNGTLTNPEFILSMFAFIAYTATSLSIIRVDLDNNQDSLLLKISTVFVFAVIVVFFSVYAFDQHVWSCGTIPSQDRQEGQNDNDTSTTNPKLPPPSSAWRVSVFLQSVIAGLFWTIVMDFTLAREFEPITVDNLPVVTPLSHVQIKLVIVSVIIVTCALMVYAITGPVIYKRMTSHDHWRLCERGDKRL